jgi:predicted transcriptional regulator
MQPTIELGIKAGEIMQEDFPILDSSLTLETCIKKLNNKYEACIVLHNGFFYSLLGYDDLLKAFLTRKTRDVPIKKIKSDNNFVVLGPETDLLQVIRLMVGWEADFVVVKDKNSMGLITKKEIAEISQLLFDSLTRGEECE